MLTDRVEWPNRVRWFDVAWVLFSLANLVAMLMFPEWETVPFHFIWVSLTILYGFRVWKARPTLVILAFVMGLTGLLIWLDVKNDITPLDELTEVPLMAAMFLAMVWHARRRLTAMEETERVSMENLRLLERERRFVQDASHELRTPITVALGHAELIQRSADDPTVADDAAVIADELMRLRRLADRLLVLAGSDDPEFLHPTVVDLETIVMDAVRRWTATPRRWLLGAAEEATAIADADRLEVALDALIENAVNHTQEQDTIEVGIHRRGSRAVDLGPRHGDGDPGRRPRSHLRSVREGRPGTEQAHGRLRSRPVDREGDRGRPRRRGAGLQRGRRRNDVRDPPPAVPGSTEPTRAHVDAGAERAGSRVDAPRSER